MFSDNLDDTDRELLNLLQVEFPLTREPFADLGRQLGIGADDVIHRIEQLKASNIIRQISPVLDARSLGYQTTLVAMRVADKQRDRAELIISQHPRVSHGYERNHHFNLWFTLALPPAIDVETELAQISRSVQPEAIVELPATKMFKLAVYWDMRRNSQSSAATDTKPDSKPPQKVELSPADRLIINELQEDLPLNPTPFTAISARIGMNIENFLAQCQSLKERGIMRRFGAAINHRQAGFKANAMTCWIASPDVVDAVGRKLASLPEVSHCYERRTSPLWQYNLFAMIHGRSREECQQIASKVSIETNLTDYILLFSTKEFKKARVKYLV